ncbi:MAG TPA: excisionase family DNA-binding protein [Candidatus Acidoferrum sp.]|nr:excisionase family DNA-binding protein [Candidatus Acidoferrum sp.]
MSSRVPKRSPQTSAMGSVSRTPMAPDSIQSLQGRAIVMLPDDETFTTQATANFLGMSRQHFVGLLESGQITHHRVGSHRRVYFKDLRAYQRKRDAERRAGMNQLFKKVEEAGVYDADYTGDAR